MAQPGGPREDESSDSDDSGTAESVQAVRHNLLRRLERLYALVQAADDPVDGLCKGMKGLQAAIPVSHRPKVAFAMGAGLARRGLTSVGTRAQQPRVQSVRAYLSGAAGVSAAPEAPGLFPDAPQGGAEENESHDYAHRGGGQDPMDLGELSQTLSLMSSTPPASQLVQNPTEAGLVFSDDLAPAVDDDEFLLISMLMDLGMAPLVLKLLDAHDGGSMRRTVEAQFVAKLRPAVWNLAYQLVHLTDVNAGTYDAIVQSFNEEITKLLGQGSDADHLFPKYAKFKLEANEHRDDIHTRTGIHFGGAHGVSATLELRFQIERMLRTAGTRRIIYTLLKAQRDRRGSGEPLILYIWRMCDEGWIHKTGGSKKGWTVALLGLSWFGLLSKRYANCVLGAMWNGGDKEKQYKEHCAADTRRCALRDVNFNTFELQIEELVRNGVTDTCAEFSDMPSLGRIQISLEAASASVDAAQALHMTHRSVQCRSPVWGTTAPLFVMNHLDDDFKLGIVGFPNIRVSQWNDLSPEERKLLVGGGSGKPIELFTSGPGADDDLMYRIHHGTLHLRGTVYIAEVLRPLASLFARAKLVVEWAKHIKHATGFKLFVEVTSWGGIDINLKTGKVSHLVEGYPEELVPLDLWLKGGAANGYTTRNRDRVVKWLKELVMPSRQFLRADHDPATFAEAVKTMHARIAASHEWLAVNLGKQFLTFTLANLRNCTPCLAADFVSCGLCLSWAAEHGVEVHHWAVRLAFSARLHMLSDRGWIDDDEAVGKAMRDIVTRLDFLNKAFPETTSSLASNIVYERAAQRAKARYEARGDVRQAALHEDDDADQLRPPGLAEEPAGGDDAAEAQLFFEPGSRRDIERGTAPASDTIDLRDAAHGVYLVAHQAVPVDATSVLFDYKYEKLVFSVGAGDASCELRLSVASISGYKLEVAAGPLATLKLQIAAAPRLATVNPSSGKLKLVELGDDAAFDARAPGGSLARRSAAIRVVAPSGPLAHAWTTLCGRVPPLTAGIASQGLDEFHPEVLGDETKDKAEKLAQEHLIKRIEKPLALGTSSEDVAKQDRSDLQIYGRARAAALQRPGRVTYRCACCGELTVHDQSGVLCDFTEDEDGQILFARQHHPCRELRTMVLYHPFSDTPAPPVPGTIAAPAPAPTPAVTRRRAADAEAQAAADAATIELPPAHVLVLLRRIISSDKPKANWKVFNRALESDDPGFDYEDKAFAVYCSSKKFRAPSAKFYQDLAHAMGAGTSEADAKDLHGRAWALRARNPPAPAPAPAPAPGPAAAAPGAAPGADAGSDSDATIGERPEPAKQRRPGLRSGGGLG
mmetsp:Transcript_3580/g.10545  ORF Transcript_3580/g.10545 Transcript_3580/m.10545 type:complete len:1323 (+) Transcript_3580:181-4149(+)